MVLRLHAINSQSANENVIDLIRNNHPKDILAVGATGQIPQTGPVSYDVGTHAFSRSYRSRPRSPVMG